MAEKKHSTQDFEHIKEQSAQLCGIAQQLIRQCREEAHETAAQLEKTEQLQTETARRLAAEQGRAARLKRLARNFASEAEEV